MESGNDEKSLPGGGMPFSKWMRKTTERYDYSDICQSPPTDGFFQLKRQKPGQNISETAECIKNQARQEAFSTLTVGKPIYSKTICEMEKASGISNGTSIQLHRQISNKESSILPEPTNMLKTVSNPTSVQSSTMSSKTIASTNATMAAPQQKKSIISNTIKEYPSIYKQHDSTQGQSAEKAAAGDKSLATRRDIPPVIITKPEENTGNLMGYVESKFGNFDNFKMWQDKSKSAPCTPTATPSSSPQPTPASSPQMGRKTGNPFFTPSSTASGSVSWLFRPPQADTGYSSDREGDSNRDILYETKYNVNPATNAVKKSYVPRPSKLRELNFWSPTTM